MRRAQILLRSVLAPDAPPLGGRARADVAPGGSAASLRTVAGVGLGVALLALLAFRDVYVTPDSVWGMIWGRDLALGESPLFDNGPTPHPLTIALAILTGTLDEWPNYVVTYLVLGPLSLGALAAAVYAVGARLATPGAGAVATLLVLTSTPILSWGASARYDVLFAALVMAALALELARPRGGPGPLLLLTAAGLVRPEAWLIAGLYWLWRLRDLDRRGAVLYAVLAAAAPCAWVAMDAAITGDPLWSLHKTETASDQLYGRFSRAENLGHAAGDLLQIAGPFALLAWPLALTRRVRERMRPLGPVWVLLAVTVGVFLLLVARGMTSSERYLLLPVCLLAVLAGVVAVSWRQFTGPLVIALMFALIFGILVRGNPVAEIRAEQKPGVEWTGEVRALVARPEVSRLLADCRAVALPKRIVSGWAYWSGRPLRRWQLDERGATRPDVYVAPSAQAAAALLTRARFDDDARFVVPPGLVPGPSTPAWRLYVRPAAQCAGGA